MANYRIQSGDCLSVLAQKFGTSVSQLAKANGIQNPNLIYAGASLKVPGHSGQSSFDGGSGGTSAPRRGGRSDGSDGTSGTQSTGGSDSGGRGSQRLADAGRAAALSMGGYNSQGLCATGVSRALSNALGISVGGNGNQIDNNLPRDKFKQVNMSLADALKIPGAVFTWEKTSTSLGSIYGHTAISAGDGHTSYSDFIETNTLAGSASRSGLKIFLPV